MINQDLENSRKNVSHNEPTYIDDTSIGEFIYKSLNNNADPDYREFHSRLVPTVDANTIIGVRTPSLRRIAKEVSKRKDVDIFLESLPHRLFDENQIHAFIIGGEKNYDKAIELYSRFLPYVDNWATCDQLPVKIFEKNPDETLKHVNCWLTSSHCYTIRFAIGILMRMYLDDLFENDFCVQVAKTRMPDSEDTPASKDDIYYVDMMRAWYFAEALHKQEQAALPYLEQKGHNAPLDEWTRRKAIQKAIESYRIKKEMKDYLRTLR